MTNEFHPDFRLVRKFSTATPRKPEPRLDQATYDALLKADPSFELQPVVTRLIPDAGFVSMTQGFTAPAAFSLLGGLRRFVLG